MSRLVRRASAPRSPVTAPSPDAAPGQGRLTPNGLTLIETMVALAIMGAVLVLALPLMSGGRGRTDLRTAASDIGAALRTARSRAVAQNHETVFLVDADRARYRPPGGPAASLPPGIRLVLVTTTLEQLAPGIGAIRFYADGSSTGGGLTLSSGGAQYDILIDWLTGRTSTQEYHGDRRS